MNPEDLLPEEQSVPEEQIPVEDGQDEGMSQEPIDEGHPDFEQMAMAADGDHMTADDTEPEPMMMLPDVILEYMDYVMDVRKDGTLAENVRSDILSAMANSIATLVPLLKDDSQIELAKMQAEMDMKQQEMEMNLQFKQAELDMKQKEHEMKLQHTQAENDVKLAMTQAQNQIQLKQQEENHNSKLVQNDQAHGQKMEQQKQASQLKQSSNPSNDKGKK